jgi:hypothetical protein
MGHAKLQVTNFAETCGASSSLSIHPWLYYGKKNHRGTPLKIGAHSG